MPEIATLQNMPSTSGNFCGSLALVSCSTRTATVTVRAIGSKRSTRFSVPSHVTDGSSVQLRVHCAGANGRNQLGESLLSSSINGSHSRASRLSKGTDTSSVLSSARSRTISPGPPPGPVQSACAGCAQTGEFSVRSRAGCHSSADRPARNPASASLIRRGYRSMACCTWSNASWALR